MALKRGEYHSKDPGSVEALTVHIDVDGVSMDGRDDSLLGHFDRVEGLYDRFDSAVGERDVLRLEYERDILGDPQVAYRKVVDHLGLAPRRR